MANDFIIGARYCPRHWPPSDWESDLDAMKARGVGLVYCGGGAWPEIEREQGRYDLARLRAFLDAATRREMRVLVSTGTGSAPAWLLRTYPHARPISAAGQPAFDAAHSWCFHHPQSREAALKLAGHLAEIFGRHAALWGWQIEGRTFPASPWGIYCYCNYAAAAFREWLKRKYGNIENLQRARRDAFFADWPDVEPPRETPERGDHPTSWLDWCQFRDESQASFYRELVQRVKAADTRHPCGAIFDDAGDFTVARGENYWQIGTELDFLAARNAPFTRGNPAAADTARFTEDLFSSIVPARPVAIYPSGPALLPFEPATRAGVEPGPTARDVGRMILASAGRGARAVLFDSWRGGSAARPLVNPDKTMSARTRAVAETAAMLDALPQLGTPFPRRAAILHSRRTVIARYGLRESQAGAVDTSLAGMHKALADLQVSAAFADESALVNGEIPGIELLVLSEAVVLSQDAVTQIGNFLTGGGKLIVCGHAAVLDPLLQPYDHEPGAGLDEILGTRVVETHLADEDVLVWQPTRVFKTRSQALVSGYRKAVETETDAKPLAAFRGPGTAADGQPGVLLRRHGMGFAAYVLFDLAGNYSAAAAPSYGSLLTVMLDAVGFERRIEVAQAGFPSGVDVRLFRNEAGVLVLVQNLADEARTVFIKVRPELKPEALWEVFTRRKVHFLLRGSDVSFDAELPALGTGAFQLE